MPLCLYEAAHRSKIAYTIEFISAKRSHPQCVAYDMCTKKHRITYTDTDTWHDTDTDMKTHQIHKITGHRHDIYIYNLRKIHNL